MINWATQFLISYSLTLSPMSVTNHQNMKPDVEKKLSRAWKANTLHPQLNIAFKTNYWQTTAWYFRDSFDNNAGGFGTGPKIDIGPYFTLGVLLGGYMREDSTHGEMAVAHSLIKRLQLIPLAMMTGSIYIPMTTNTGPEINCGSAVVLTNCQLGWRISW